MSKQGYLTFFPWAIAALGVLFIVGFFLWDGGAIELGWGVALAALGAALVWKRNVRRGKRGT